MKLIADGQSLVITQTERVVVEGDAYSVRVRKDATVDLGGRVWNGVVVDRGGRAVLYGICRGGLKNSGDVEVRGILIGGISGSGQTLVDPGAIIDGVRGRDLAWKAPDIPNEEVTFDGRRICNATEEGWLTVVGETLVETPMVVDRYLNVLGGAANGVQVPADSTLIVTGTVAGGITVDPGGHVAMNGTCIGGIANNGEVDIAGVLYGDITGDGQTRVAPNALINGVAGSDLRQ